jgi:hypothetical protein
MCSETISGPNIAQIVKADPLTFCNSTCAENWLNAEIEKENKKTNTKARHLEILDTVRRVLQEAGGIETYHALPKDQQGPRFREMAIKVKNLCGCSLQTARNNMAKILRQTRGEISMDNWGGPRTPGPGKKLGPPKMSEDQKRERVSTRLAPGFKELAQAITEIKGLPGWGHVVDVALVLMVEGDQELKVKLGEMGFSYDRSRDN